MLKIKKILFLIFTAVFLFTANYVFANPGETGETRDLSVNLSNFLGFTTISGLPEYISRIYNIMIGLAGGIASFMMIVAGFQYVTAHGNKGKIDKAVKRIENSIVGLFLVFGAYLILNTINPALLSLKLPEIKTIARDELAFGILPDSEKKLVGETAGSLSCPQEDRVVPIGENADNWCEENCHETHTDWEVSRRGGEVRTAGQTTETRVCCHCVNPREGARELSRSPGSERECLLQVITESMKTDPCTPLSGTDGTCVESRGRSRGAVRYCEWTPTRCSSNADCERIGSRHCFGGQCYQRKLAYGEACNNNNDAACLSGDCHIRINNGDYAGEGESTLDWRCAVSPVGCALDALIGDVNTDYYCAPPEGDRISMDYFCSEDEECQSGTCRFAAGTARNRAQCR